MVNVCPLVAKKYLTYATIGEKRFLSPLLFVHLLFIDTVTINAITHCISLFSVICIVLPSFSG